MLHDRDLLDRLSAFAPIRYDGEVYRATRRGLDALTASTAGGRWMVRDQMPTLYTSCESDGALAEIAFHWGQLDPLPARPAFLHRIRLATRKSLRFARSDLMTLGVNWDHYGDLAYRRTQEVGAAVAHLGCDGLLVPCARWSCENAIIFLNNCEGGGEVVTRLDTQEVDWIDWARRHGALPKA